MELPPARNSSQNSKKRVLPGGNGNTVNAQGAEVLPATNWRSKSGSSKQKAPVCFETIDDDVMLTDADGNKISWLDMKVGCSPSFDISQVDQVQSSKKHCPLESHKVIKDYLVDPDDLFIGDYVDDVYFEDDMDQSEYSILQSRFDRMDAPPGVEVPIPWMPSSAKAKTASITASTSSTSKAPSFPISQPTPGPKLATSFNKQGGSTNLLAGKSYNIQGSNNKVKFNHLNATTTSSSWHTSPLIPAASYVPSVPPPLPGWPMDSPLNMTAAQASSGWTTNLPVNMTPAQASSGWTRNLPVNMTTAQASPGWAMNLPFNMTTAQTSSGWTTNLPVNMTPAQTSSGWTTNLPVNMTPAQTSSGWTTNLPVNMTTAQASPGWAMNLPFNTTTAQASSGWTTNLPANMTTAQASSAWTANLPVNMTTAQASSGWAKKLPANMTTAQASSALTANLPVNMTTAQASSGWAKNLPANMTTAQASSTWMANLPVNMTPAQASFAWTTNLPVNMTTGQAAPGFSFAPGYPSYPGYMDYAPQQFPSGYPFGPDYYTSHAHPWMQGPHNIATTSENPSSEEQQPPRDLGGSLKNFRLFKKFDTVQDHSGHHYASLHNQASKLCAKRIQGEWKILEKDLPDTIFVRVYETRMDLLRAVIVGADGTPYHDGLFFFDVHFPNNYPDSPPLVHYHSFGLRINPNLYECGKVCLSLLNTWTGRGKEMWIPRQSTMLQVLVSIQALILNEKPYFNEPGYSDMMGSPLGEQSSQQYNENVYIDNLKTMVYCMRRPPQHFEDFVIGHYFQSCRDILAACKEYLNGAQVGTLVRGCVLDGDKGKQCCSNGFKAILRGYIKTLVEAFTKIGAKDCDKFIDLGEQTLQLPVDKRRFLL